MRSKGRCVRPTTPEPTSSNAMRPRIGVALERRTVRDRPGPAPEGRWPWMRVCSHKPSPRSTSSHTNLFSEAVPPARTNE